MPMTALSSRLGEKAPYLISAVLLIGFSLWLAWQSLDLINLTREPLPVVLSEPVIAQAPVSLEHLFGTPAHSAQSPSQATNLQLHLLGSFVHSDPARSSAVILHQGQSAKRYSVGMEIESGVRLDAVYAEHVELVRNGRREHLSFPKAQLLSPTPTSYADQPAGQSNPHDLLEQLSQADRDALEQLRLRMQELRGDVTTAQAPSALATDQTMESD